jgi:methyltransferase-like protein
VTQDKTTSYDEMPYVHVAFPQTHPDHLVTLAKLFGLDPPPVATCRVLELGCATGDNLIPMAFGLPRAQFVGVDNSTRQIASARELAAQLKLDNIDLRVADIGEIDATWGRFDYIICHGIYSWVPEPIRSKVLAICSENLAPNGVAYVSYNTLPGWRTRGMVREMMIYHADQFADPGTKVTQARSLLDFLSQSAPPNSPYSVVLKAELEILRGKADGYLFHEHLERVNDAFYFSEFMSAAARHNLQYLGEAAFADMVSTNFDPPVVETLHRMSTDLLRMEQYMDFVRNRTFRQTLLVHAGVEIRRRLDWRFVQSCRIAGFLRTASAKPVLAQGVVESFEGRKGTIFTIHESVTKAALMMLSERWPGSIPFPDLLAGAQARLPARPATSAADSSTPGDAEILSATLLQCYAFGVVDLLGSQTKFTVEPSPRPRVSALALAQAQRRIPVTNARHESITLEDSQREILSLLDGTRDRTMLMTELTALVGRGALQVRSKGGDRLASGSELTAALHALLDDALSFFAKSALLIE